MSIQDIQARHDAIGEGAGGTPAMDIGDGWQAHEDVGELLVEIARLRGVIAAANNALVDVCHGDHEHQIECHADTLPEEHRRVASAAQTALDVLSPIVWEMVDPDASGAVPRICQPSEPSERAKRLAEAAEIQIDIDRNAYGWSGDLGDWAEHGGLRLLLAEIREANAALAALGVPDDGRPLAERIQALWSHVLIARPRSEADREKARAARKEQEEAEERLDRFMAEMAPPAKTIKLVREDKVAEMLAAERDKARAEGYDAGYKAGEEHWRECAEADGRCSRGEHGWSDSMPGECPDCGVDVAPPDITAPEPPPIATGSQPIWPLVIADAEALGCSRLIPDMRARDAFGQAKYGTPVTADNGRNHLADAYQEALDGVVYLRAAMVNGADVGLLYAEAMRVAMRIRDAIDGREDPVDTAARELGEMPDAEFAEHMERAKKMLRVES